MLLNIPTLHNETDTDNHRISLAGRDPEGSEPNSYNNVFIIMSSRLAVTVRTLNFSVQELQNAEIH